MKKSLLKFLPLVLFSLTIASFADAQEYDDLYFRKSDREKLKELRAQESPTYGRNSYLHNEIDKLEGADDDEDMLSAYNQNNSRDQEEYSGEKQQPIIVEKHYYYNGYSRYDRDFDDIFWSDPFLYQGTIFDPTMSYYGGRPSYWRPGWNVSLSFGNSHRWNRSRWSGNYWGNNGYHHYGYYDAWSYNSWNYNNYWCSPNYGYRGQVIVYGGHSGESRGITRGRRSSRNSSATYSRNSGRTGRISNWGDAGGKDNSGGRFDDNSKNYRNANRSSNNRSSNSRNSSYSNKRSGNKTRTYTGRSTNTNNSRSNSYRSGSRSSGSGGTRSSSNTRSSSSSSNSKSSSSSRSSRSKRD